MVTEKDIVNDSLTAQGVPPLPLPPEQKSLIFKDGDTAVDTTTGKTIRIGNLNTLETQKTGSKASDFKAGQLGGDAQTAIGEAVAQRENFTQPTYRNSKDKYTRELGTLSNPDTGDNYSDYMIRNRLADPYMVSPNSSAIDQRSATDLNNARDAAQWKPKSYAQNLLTALNDVRNLQPLTAKVYAPTAQMYGDSLDERGNSKYYAGPATIGPDENYRGEARNQLTAGLNLGTMSMNQGAWNALDMLGSVTGSKGMQEYAQEKSGNYRYDLENTPRLRNAEAFDENGKWKLDSFSKMSDYAIGLAASSLPQMALSAGSMLLSPITFGTSNAIPALVFAGQTWENQPKDSKDVGWALASGVTQQVLENLSLGHIKGNILKKPTQDRVIAELAAKGYSESAAKDLVVTETQLALKGVSTWTKSVAIKEAEDAAKKVTAKSLAYHTGHGIVSEGITEALQEATQYIGEQRGFNLPDNPEDMYALQNRILNAGAGGAVLGGVFSGGGHALASTLGKSAQRSSTSDLDIRNQLMGGLNFVPHSEDVANDAVKNMANDASTLKEMAQSETDKRRNSGLGGGIVDWFKEKGLNSTWQKWATTIRGSDTGGMNLNAIWTLIGAAKTLNGGSIEEQQSGVLHRLSNAFGSPDDIRAAFGGKLKLSEIKNMMSNPELKEDFSNLMKMMESHGLTAQQAFERMSGVFRSQPEHTSALVGIADRFNSLLNEHGKITGSRMTADDFFNMAPLNKNAIAQNTSGFITKLKNVLGMDSAAANELANRYLNSNDIVTLLDPTDDALSAMLDDYARTSKESITSLRTKLNQNKSEFSEFLHNDPLENAYALAAKGAATFVHQNLIGKDGSKLAALIKQAVATKEIGSERASFIAKELKDYLDMRNGVYHPITNKYAKGALQLVNFLSTVSSLPLAAISSLTEFSQVYRHLNTEQSLKATKAILKGFGAEFANAMQIIGGKPQSESVKNYRNSLFEAGFPVDGSMAQRQDIVTDAYRKWTEGFFKMTGLTSVTNVTRYAKLSIGADAIKSWVDAVNGNNPQAKQNAMEHLIRVGVDAEWISSADMSIPANKERLAHEFSTGTHNFTVEAVIHPTKMNRPKFYSDPYLQLFTQFQGYTSAFTANVLPMLLKDLRKSGSADQVNAAATIAMMFALSYFALYLKDIIKYGESPPPWLKEEQRFQRYIGQVGLTGTGQRIWDAVNPVIPQSNQKQSFGMSVLNGVVDQAPALSYLSKVNDAISASDGKRIEKAARTLPIVGTSSLFAKKLQKELGDN